MSIRTRVREGKSIEESLYLSDGTSQLYETSRYTEVIRDYNPGPGSCSHTKLIRGHYGDFFRNSTQIVSGRPLITPIYDSYYMPLVTEHVRNIIDRDLKGAQFEILPFLLELDETIAMFTRKFLAQAIKNPKGTYGMVTWGIQPFISDLKKLLNDVRNIYGKMPTIKQSIKRMRRVSYKRPWGTHGIPLDIVGTVRVRGERTFLFPAHAGRIQKALWLLDQIGFHPDLKTVWDILPYSFAVDYFLPVGDILESLHPRGWIRSSSSFDGTYSFKGQVAVGHNLAAGDSARFNVENWTYYSVYERGNVPSYDSPAFPEWKAPSLKEVFNTAYLFSAIKNFI